MVHNKLPKDLSELAISHPCISTALIQPGSTFIALKGSRADGRAFIEQACTAGAAHIIYQSDPAWEKKLKSIQQQFPSVLFIPTEVDPHQYLPELAQKVYGHSLPNNLIAITGTNGKTSVAYFTYQLCATFSPAAYLGTTGIETSIPEVAGKLKLPELTTPDIFSMYQALHQLKRNGIDTVCLEASSHGLELGRLAGLRFKTVAFTNLSQDHLDFHPSMEAYFKAKQKLFTDHVTPDTIAVVNIDDPWGDKLSRTSSGLLKKILTCGINPKADLHIESVLATDHGLQVSFTYDAQSLFTTLPFFGSFQAYNVLMALLITYATFSKPLSKLIEKTDSLSPPKGRMQFMGTSNQGAKVFVDFAHTPDALETAITSLKEHFDGKLYAVFGCGGDRDKTKRPLMGKACHNFADVCIVTDDNPRTEDPAVIRSEILKACPNALEVDDRKAAIEKALKDAQVDDCILIMGKGHEEGQIIGRTKFKFSDIQIVKDYLLENAQDIAIS